ncbi:MAG: hypothetical protein GY913_26640 [Proteobacteria bacterium]|nr:hypothetical protein [Pseudomonadota bacterium]MCP4920494.1 hypothetical protein [Pseudomonadota bacterium]
MIWLLACSRFLGDPVSEPPVEPEPPADAAEGFPGSADVLGYEPTFGDLVEREALYVVAPFSGGKRLQAVQLVFDDGTSWIRSYRPLISEYEFIDKRVVVTGRPYENSPYVQSVGGTHFEVETIALAPGETAWDSIPTVLPAPPQVRTAAELEARQDLWAHVVGTLSSVDYDGHTHAAVLVLDDGTSVPFVLFAPTSFGPDLRDEDPKTWVGRRITALGRVWDDAGTRSLGLANVCEGEVTRCHMTLDNAR